MSRRVAVTGARGFIGTHLTAHLSARGDTVVRIQRPYDPATLAAALSTVDAVVHLAGVISAARRRDYVTGNVDGTRTVARAAGAAGVSMIHMSSLAAAGPAPPTAPRREEDAPRPMTTYGISKLEGERAVIETRDLKWTILRPGVVYGPGDRAMKPLFAYARRGILPLVGSPSAAYTFIYIDDAVRAIAAALDQECHHDTIFVGNARPVTPRELIEAIRAAVNPAARIAHVPSALVRIAALVGDCAALVTRRPATINSRRYAELYSPGFVCCVDRMRERLGVVADVELADGIMRTAKLT